MIFSIVESEPRYRLRYRLRWLYQNINSLSDALSEIWNMLFIRRFCFVPDIFKVIYFHFLCQVVVIGEEVNREIFLTLIWVGLLGVRFEVGGKITPPV